MYVAVLLKYYRHQLVSIKMTITLCVIKFKFVIKQVNSENISSFPLLDVILVYFKHMPAYM